MPLRNPLIWWDTIRTSLWFVPGVMAVLAVVLSLIVPELDYRLDAADQDVPIWVYAGGPDGARTILSTVAGSLITIVGVVFSITIVVLQQASSQFTPRVMGNFMRQTGTQLTLGIFLATFLYSLLTLRYVRGEGPEVDLFIPRLSIAVSMLLAAACLGFLVYFIHHMATSLQASMVLANVNQEFREDVGPLYPEHIGQPANDDDRSLEEFRREYMPVPTMRVEADQSGYVLSVDEESILGNVPETRGVAILPQIGEFVIRGTPIIEIGEVRELTDDQRRSIRNCLRLGSERSRFQDPLFSIRQLADIALKALSPSINDPTTAKNAISMLGDCIALLATREFPDRVRLAHRAEDDPRGAVHIWTNRPPFSAYVEEAFSELRRESLSKVSVTGVLIDTVGDIADSVESQERAEPLHQLLTDILRGVERAGFDERDEQFLKERIDIARKRILAEDESVDHASRIAE